MKHIFSLPNQITFFRIILIPVFVIFLLIEMPYGDYIAAFIFIILSLSDALDGYIARKKQQTTGLGKILDPIADKLLISAALIFLIGRIPLWMVVIIIAREWIITMLRLIVLPKHVIPAEKLGKIKTVIQTVAIISVIINFPFNWYFMLIAVIITLISGLGYLVKIMGMLDEKILNIPNIITFMRLVLLPLFVITMLNSKLNYSLIIIGIIVLSDKLDGISARMMNQVTEFGRALDSFTDWSVLLISFFLFVILGYLHFIWILLLIFPSIMMFLSKIFFLRKQKKIPITPIAKISVGMTYVTIVAILINFIYKDQILIITFILIYLSMFRYILLSSGWFKSFKYLS
ncbi:MAG: CDP-diacylglycerol--glycerol-3-phosphate 3-phosphatidyltransferase [Nanoarchaeota archaeon]|nr:CDP-diacylglycerol--glycerol-3-phosphate 3-phosphatidyltransferase [Nanoarchaeota archaeon]